MFSTAFALTVSQSVGKEGRKLGSCELDSKYPILFGGLDHDEPKHIDAGPAAEFLVCGQSYSENFLHIHQTMGGFMMLIDSQDD